MTIDPDKVRIEGVYPQRQEGFFMQRVKLAAGVISALQARTVADVAARFGKSGIHLTVRGSMEIHWLDGKELPLVKQELAKCGLTSRGACGGAVRGISCSSQATAEFPLLESLARRLHRYFTGNPHFEGLPKKFKIGIETDTACGRHLIQDVGLVFAGENNGVASYDVWIAGGLGREPRPGFLLAKAVAEERVVPVIEAVVRVYARLAPPPKRLKFLAAGLGEDELRRLIEAEPSYGGGLSPASGFPDNLTAPAKSGRLVAAVFAGQLTAKDLRALADFADKYAGGMLQVTADQDIAFTLAANTDIDSARLELQSVARSFSPAGLPAVFRVCPGSHECKMGLVPTREIAQAVVNDMPESAKDLAWAISGCPNSCSQPQLADAGIVCSRLTAVEGGEKVPMFDLYRRSGNGLGDRVLERLTLAQLLTEVRTLA